MNSLYDLPAPAKLNLVLHITGRRADGYHLMQSVFVLLDWADTLHIERIHSSDVSRSDLNRADNVEALPVVDLTVRAARLLQQATGYTHGAHIMLHKRLPTQAGLGGGSSDAATCLLALNRLWQTNLSRADLMTLGVQLGADVPFFLFGCTAWAEGIGESLQRVDVRAQDFVVVKPPAGLATHKIFNDPALERNTEHATIQGFAEHIASSPVLFGQNDLQAVAQTHCPDIAACIKWLSDAHLDVRMTGSGSAVFAPCSASAVLPDCPSNWVVQRCRSLPMHPLIDWAS